MEYSTVAFTAPSPLPCARCPFRRVTFVCSRRSTNHLVARYSLSSEQSSRQDVASPSPSAVAAARRAATVAAAVFVSLCSVFGSPGRSFAAQKKIQTPAPSSTKALRYDGRQELAGPQKAVSLTLTGGAFAALGVWAYKKNRVDDELETIRIKEEVERLEKLKAEFENVEEDDDSLDDETFMAELNKRIAQDAAAENADEVDGDETEPGDSSATNADSPSASSSKPSGTTTLERPSSGTETGSSRPPTADADIEKLRRMWEADSHGDDKRNVRKQ